MSEQLKEQFVIEKGIPISIRSGRGKLTDTLMKMEVGDSFECDKKTRAQVGCIKRQNESLRKRDFTTRAVDQFGQSFRVWRTK